LHRGAHVSRWLICLQEAGAKGKFRHSKARFLAQNQLYDRRHMVFNPWNRLSGHVRGMRQPDTPCGQSCIAAGTV
jgi:hypothetical protein